MSNGNLLMEEWEEFKRWENFQQMQREKKPVPEPEPVNPHLCYTQGSHGQTIADYGAFSRDYKPEQLEIHSSAPDKRFNDDPQEFYKQVCDEEMRIWTIPVAGTSNGQMTLL